MVKLYEDGIYLRGGSEVVPAAEAAERGITQTPEDAKRGTIAYSILQAHNTSGDPEALKIRFDAMASHDITFVGIIQTARASGMEQFPLPYVLTNCHNSLCAVGGTINEDDHVFGLSAAKKYGGIFVPGVLRSGIFLSSMAASPPSTFFSCAFKTEVAATRAVAVKKLRRVFAAMTMDDILSMQGITVAEIGIINDLQKSIKANKVITFLGGGAE